MPPRSTPQSFSSFNSTPPPTLIHTHAQHSPRRIQLPTSPTTSDHDSDDDHDVSPGAFHTGNDLPGLPLPPDLTSPASIQLPFRPRNHSPSNFDPQLPRFGGALSMPPMQRANSSPGMDSTGRFITPTHSIQNTPRRPSSPLSAGRRRRSPLRSTFEETYPSWNTLNMEPNIPEHAELEITSEDSFRAMASIPSYSNTFPRSRRRPASPLHQSASAPSLYARAASPYLSGTSSPALFASKYSNEMYPTYSFGSVSSMPSTPTSLRSRSPSISSLDTIEDTPDAEEAARLEAEETKTKSEESEGYTDARRRSLELRSSGLRNSKERKRWSVCGAERRADFSLEPIEE